MFPADVDRALALPRADRGAALSALEESQWFERKSGRIAPKDLAVPMIAMANAEGGVIIVGLHGGMLDDVTVDPGRLNAWNHTAMDFTRPPVRSRCDMIECLSPEGTTVRLLKVTVDPGTVVHESVSGDCYLRSGDESRKLTFAQRQELTYDRGPEPYDGTAIDATTDELSLSLIADLRESVGATLDIHALLTARSLLQQSGRLTVAAYLLFGGNPSERMPHAHVRVVKYTENERGTGRRLTLDAAVDHRCEGPIPQVLHDAAAAIESAMPRRRALTSSGRFEAVPLVPRDAWLEGLVNAVIHRSYSAAGDHIRIEIFPNRIEIESPGRFPGIADLQRPLNITRYARNPRIARVCADLNIGRELGEGIHRIFDEMRIAGLSDPIYEQTPQSTRLILPASAALPQAVRERLPRGSERILAVLRAAQGPLGTGDLVDASGLSRPTVTKTLQELRHAGLVDWNAKSPKDPRATWTMR